jgi:ATP diphosphatase
VIAKLHEEIAEVQVELARAGDDPLRAARLQDEIGDLLFVCIHLARKAQVDAGSALRQANAKFERRFRAMEAIAHGQGTTLRALDLAAREALWAQAKQAEGEPEP